MAPLRLTRYVTIHEVVNIIERIILIIEFFKCFSTNNVIVIIGLSISNKIELYSIQLVYLFVICVDNFSRSYEGHKHSSFYVTLVKWD